MSSAEAAGIENSSSLPVRLIRAIISLILGALLSLTAVTSIILLGWLIVLMRRRVLAVSGRPVTNEDQPRWLLGVSGKGWLTRVFGGLAANIKLGLSAALSLWIATFPFAVFWLVAWWAGWENSFNKGYEQAFVGPLVGVAGIAVFVVIMVYLPMALVHQAVEQRAFSFFELRRVRSVVRHTGWGYVFWAFSTVFLALPIFASRGLPAFAEGIYPGVADMSAEQITTLRDNINLAVGAYAFIALVILKRWSASIYAAAANRASDAGTKRPWRVSRLIRFICLGAIWTSLAVLIFVGQFLNHEWHVWLTHPFVFLPWVM